MRLVIYCTAAERRVLRWSGGRLRPEALFCADESGLAAFREYLRSREGAVATLVADIAGEEFHEEQIPLLHGSDRAAVVQRRIAQRFPEARLATALSLGRVAAERRKERLLLASFSDARPLEPWLDALIAMRVRLAGVYSTALFAPALAARAGRRASHCIVASAHASGLRLSFLEQGRLRFARFESIQASNADAYASRAHAEIGRLADYLTTLRALPAGAKHVPVIVIAGSAQQGSLERRLVADGRFAFRVETLGDAARRLGVQGTLPELGAEQLALALAASRPPREQFARGADRLGFVQSRLQRALLAAGTLGFAACAAYAGVHGFDVLEMQDQARALRLEALEASQRYQRMAAAFPATPTSAENLRLAVQELRRIAARTAPPEAALAHVARALEQCPQVALEALDWSVTPAAAAQASASKAMAQTIEITARIVAAPRADVRAIQSGFERFSAALQADRSWQIVRSRLPYDITPQGTLKDHGGAASGGEAPPFVIVIERRSG